MAGKKQLPPVRAVAPGEKAPPVTVSGAFLQGSRLDELKAMFRVLAAHIDNENTLARDLAPLTKHAREISKEIETLEEIESERAYDDEDVTNDSGDTAWRPQAI